VDRPKLLGMKAALEERLSQINDAHMAALTNFVHCLRERMGDGAAIPYMDPWDGGLEAEVLFLLEAPGAKAKNSGFVSMNNPDETAKNFFEIIHQVGIDRKRMVMWNTVPWYIGSGDRIRPATTSDIVDGIESLAELLQLLPKLRVIVLVGEKAKKAEKHVRGVAPHLEVFATPHPSPMFVNRKPGNRDVLLHGLRAVKIFLGS